MPRPTTRPCSICTPPGAIGTFDSAVIEKDEDGKVHVHKTEKPTQHGAWTGAGVGALVGILFPPAIIGSAIVGAGAGGLIGHLRGGVSRDDLKDLGDELEAGNAAVIVLGESKIEEQLEKAVTRANKVIEKQVDADAEELQREIDAGGQGGRGAQAPGGLGRSPRAALRENERRLETDAPGSDPPNARRQKREVLACDHRPLAVVVLAGVLLVRSIRANELE